MRRRIHKKQLKLFAQLTSEHSADKYNPQFRERALPLHWRIFHECGPVRRGNEYCPHVAKVVPIELMCLVAEREDDWSLATLVATPEFKKKHLSWLGWARTQGREFKCALREVCQCPYHPLVHKIATEESPSLRRQYFGEAERAGVSDAAECGILSNKFLTFDAWFTQRMSPHKWEHLIHNTFDGADTLQVAAFRGQFDSLMLALPAAVAEIIMKYAYETGPVLMEFSSDED
jgi:hypothetical protein